MLSSEMYQFVSPNSVDNGDLPPSTRRMGEIGSSSFIRASGSSSTSKGGDDSYIKKNGSFSSSSTSSSRSSSPATPNSSFDMEQHSPPRPLLPASYKEERRSSRRLLNDIQDLDLSPVPARTYDSSYAEDDEREQMLRLQACDAGSSLPSVEEARAMAANMLDRYEDKVSKSSRSLMFHDDGKRATLGVSSSKYFMPIGSTIKLDSPSRREQRYDELKRFFHRYYWYTILPCIALAFVAFIYTIVSTREESITTINGVGQETNSDTPPEIVESIDPTRYLSTIQALSDWKISDETSLTTENTPQNKAARWISDSDLLQYEIPQTRNEDSTDSLDTHFRFVQRYVLAVLYYSWHGKDWVDDLQWMSATDECAWFKLSPMVPAWSQRSYVHGVTCHADMRIREIFLHSNSVRGKWVQEIQHLTKLEILSLSDNILDGTLPTSSGFGWDKLSNLQYLDLTYNGFYGALPEELGNLSELQVLALSNNALSGTIPDTFASLHALRTLAIDDNTFTGTLDFCKDLIDLEYFYADRNSFHAMVDDTFMAQHSRLRELDLSSNLLECDDNGFPLHLLQHPTLRVLDLASNKLGGQFIPNDPTVVVNTNTALEYLSVHANKFTGTVPSALYNFQGLKHLDLQSNLFSGAIPNDFEFLSNLEYLFIGYNQLYLGNTFPNVILSMPNLRELSLARSQLQSGIPHWLGETLPSLSLLDLSNNNMKGGIPESLWELPKLAYLFLDHNDFTGMVPPVDVTPPSTLNVLMIHKNQDLSGNATELCDASTDLALFGLDCGDQWSCTDACCLRCCPVDDDTCFDIQEANYMVSVEGLWEYGYARDTNGYDPYLLDQTTGLMSSELAGEPVEATQP